MNRGERWFSDARREVPAVTRVEKKSEAPVANHILVTICVLASALASCGSDGNGGGLSGACATLADGNPCSL
jgi:hypothetical protein